MFNLRQASARSFAAPIAGASLFAAVPAAAQDAHGVIAFGETAQGKGVAYGFSWNLDGKDEAHAKAVNACISSGGTDCVQLAWFQNGCGALAMDQYGNAQGKPGMSREQAEARALRTCEAAGGGGCNIVGSTCATPGGEPGIWSGSESVLPAHGSQATATGPEDESLTREERIRVQQSLTALGFDAGPADGEFGRRTRSAIWEWQNAEGLEATGYVTREQAESLTAVDAEAQQELDRRKVGHDGLVDSVGSRGRAPPAAARPLDSYGQLVGRTYTVSMINEEGEVFAREFFHFGNGGHTDYVSQSCLGEAKCSGITKVKDRMVESNFTCDNGDEPEFKFSLEGVQNLDRFTVVLAFSSPYGNSGKPVYHEDTEFIWIEDSIQVPKIDCAFQ